VVGLGEPKVSGRLARTDLFSCSVESPWLFRGAMSASLTRRAM
jgi:hypothetical protein